MKRVMRHLHLFTAALIACASVLLPVAASAQAVPDTFVTWIDGRVQAAIAEKKAAAQAAAEARKIGENGNGTANQKEAPSADNASTSLVDSRRTWRRICGQLPGDDADLIRLRCFAATARQAPRAYTGVHLC